MSGFEVVGIVLGILPRVVFWVDILREWYDPTSAYLLDMAHNSALELEHLVEETNSTGNVIGTDIEVIYSEFARLAGVTVKLAKMAQQHQERQNASIWTLARKMRRKNLKKRVASLNERLENIQEKLRTTLSHRVSSRVSDIRAIEESEKFNELSPYGKAAVSALLEEYRTSTNDDYALRYYSFANQFINRNRVSTTFRQALDSGLQLSSINLPEDEFTERVDEAVLELLQYQAMDKRTAEITAAHEASCEWVYDEVPDQRWENLSDWLARGAGIYLIVGNEASGKSTMMKYIFRHGMTLTRLREWDHPGTLVMAAFFFWRNGTRLEKSEEGLWRSLLNSVLSQQRQLIPCILPKVWATLYPSMHMRDLALASGLGSWSVAELRNAIKRLVNQDQQPLKLFFLIDGIDEYQHEGNDQNIIDLLQFIKEDVVSSGNAKILLSSRPLEAFNQVGLHSSLTLHDMNRNSIELYVRNIFDNDEEFLRGRRNDSNRDAEALIEYILTTSKGIFLSAVLFVRTVKHKLASGDGLHKITLDLKKGFRPELRDLYKVIWDGIDNTDKAQASQMLQIVLTGDDIKRNWLGQDDEPLRLIDLTLALGNADDTIQAPILPWEMKELEVQTKCTNVATAFMNTWPGFITTVNPTGGRAPWKNISPIRYCHRSVPEFFRENGSLLRESVIDNFCPYIAHLKATVQQLKILPSPLPEGSLLVLWTLTNTALLAAKYVDDRNQDHPAYHKLLEQLDRTMQHHHKSLQRDASRKYLRTVIRDHRGTVALDDGGLDAWRISAMHWSNFHSDPECAHPRAWHDSFLSLVVEFGLHNYLKSQLSSSAKTKNRVTLAKKGRPVLFYALSPKSSLLVAPYGLVTHDLLQTLLEHGARPNDKFEGLTAWEAALRWQHDMFAGSMVRASGGTNEDLRRAADERAKICKILLAKGADGRAAIKTRTERTISARQVMKESLEGWLAEESLQELLKSLPEDKTRNSSTFRVM